MACGLTPDQIAKGDYSKSDVMDSFPSFFDKTGNGTFT